MFRVVFLATITHTSDAQMSCAILSDAITRLFTKVPPGTFISRQAIWDYREFFVESGVCETITNMHLDELRAQGLLTDGGAMILDGSFVEASKQRNTREENKMIKEGRGNELWNDQPAKKRQKDIDARWTKKNDEVHFGYKIHALVDAVHILDFTQGRRGPVGIEMHDPVPQAHVPVGQIIETHRQIIGTSQIYHRQTAVIRIGTLHHDGTEIRRLTEIQRLLGPGKTGNRQQANNKQTKPFHLFI